MDPQELEAHVIGALGKPSRLMEFCDVSLHVTRLHTWLRSVVEIPNVRYYSPSIEIPAMDHVPWSMGLGTLSKAKACARFTGLARKAVPSSKAGASGKAGAGGKADGKLGGKSGDKMCRGSEPQPAYRIQGEETIQVQQLNQIYTNTDFCCSAFCTCIMPPPRIRTSSFTHLLIPKHRVGHHWRC